MQCAIQACLQRNAYNERKCSHLIDALYECCAEFYRRQGEDASSVCCPKYTLLKLKISQRQQAETDAELRETRKR
ncbi:Cx9C motif-containing protein 4, mitochondrial [Kalaharituber pfeilii]|nr:Cx9C motif-containing protein 4, mitochondrial [Kalaharituber pfeilii]